MTTTETPGHAGLRGTEPGSVGDFNLRYLLEILFRRKRAFLVPLVLTPLLSLLLCLLIKPTFMSTTTILLGKEDILNPLVRYETAVAMTESNRLGSFEKIIFSRPLIEDTIHKLALDKEVKSDSQMEALVNRTRKDIHVFELAADSFQIGCTASDPHLAKKMVETVSQLFIEKSLMGSRREAMAAVNLIQKELDHYQQELERTQFALQEFRQTNMETLGQIATLGGQLNDYRAKTLEADLELKQEQLNEKLLSQRLAGEKPMVVAQALYVQNTPYQKQYQELQLRMGNLLSTRDKSHPEVMKLQREMDYITHLLEDEKNKGEASETQEVRSPVYQEVSARLEDTRIKIRVLEQKAAEYQQLQDETRKRLTDAPELEKEQSRMEGDVKLTRELYDTLRLKLEQARVSSEVEMEQQTNRFTIVDPPQAPLSRYKPVRKVYLFGGVLGGVCLGFFLIFLLEFSDPRLVRSEELLRRTGLKQVGVLPKLYRFEEIRKYRAWLWLKQHFPFSLLSRGMGQFCHPEEGTQGGETIPVVGPLRDGLRKTFCAARFILPSDMPPSLIINPERLQRMGEVDADEEEALDDFIERVRSTGIAARNSHDASDRLVWMVTSARAEEGKTVLTANLGMVLASDLKKPIVLVDADMQSPALSGHFGSADLPGMAEVIEGRATLDEALVDLEVPGLSLLPAGRPTEYPEVLYNTAAFRTLMETLRVRFALTVIDAPGLLTNSTGRLIAPQVDGVLLVARLYATKFKPFEAAIQKLPPGKIIGVVFNYAEYWIPDWLYKWV